jgi:YegS/Rv2252/BmrU family lipid kinase
VTWWVIVNPWAGRKGEAEARARAALDSRGIDYELRVSANADDVTARVAEGRRAGARRFASVGGDGTAHLVLNGLLAESWPDPPTLAVLPAGSGSDFIKTFGLPKRLEPAADHLVSDDVYRCDVGVLEGSFGAVHFLNVADIGVAAASVRITHRLPRFLGGLRYGIGFWLTLAGFPSREIRLEAGGRSYEGPAINIVAANGQFFGGGMNIAPRASLMDGLFDIQVFKGPRRQAFAVMPRVVRGTHLHHPGVRRFEAETFTLSCPGDWPVEADGEVLGTGPVRGRMVPGAIDFKI